MRKSRFITNDIEEYFEDIEQYKRHESLYKISGEHYNSIMSDIISKKHYKKNDSYKDAIREAINRKLKLSSLDSIIFTNDTIYIKLFMKVKCQTEEEKRACGLDPDILNNTEQKYYNDKSYKEKSINLLKFTVEDQLSFKKITPLEFKKIFIPTFINIMEIIVIEDTDIEDITFLKGFSLFLLRKVFDDFLLYIAEDILFNFSNNDKTAMDFLSFFSVYESVDAKGVKHKANPILDESNRAWNLTTIRSTMLQYKHAKQEIYNIKNEMLVIRKKLQEHELEFKELNSLKNDEIINNQNIDKKIEETGDKLEKAQDSASKKLKYKNEGEERIYEKRELINILFKKEDELLQNKKANEKRIKEIEAKILNKQKDLDLWEKKYSDNEKKLKQIEEKGHPIDDQYQRLKFALAKTLAKR